MTVIRMLYIPNPPCGYCVRKGKNRAALDRRAIQEVTEVVIKKKERRVYSLINCAPTVSSIFVFHRQFQESLFKRRDLELETFFCAQRSLGRASEEGTLRGARRLCKRTYKFEKRWRWIEVNMISVFWNQKDTRNGSYCRENAIYKRAILYRAAWLDAKLPTFLDTLYLLLFMFIRMIYIWDRDYSLDIYNALKE